MPEQSVEITLSAASETAITDWIYALPDKERNRLTDNNTRYKLDRTAKGHTKRMLDPANRRRLAMENMWYEYTPVVVLDENRKPSVKIKEQQFRRRSIAQISVFDRLGYPTGTPKPIDTASIPINDKVLERLIAEAEHGGSLRHRLPLTETLFKGLDKIKESGLSYRISWGTIPNPPGTVTARSIWTGNLERVTTIYRPISRWMVKTFQLSANSIVMKEFNELMAVVAATEDPANIDLEWIPAGGGRITKAYRETSGYAPSCMTSRRSCVQFYDKQTNLFFVKMKKNLPHGAMPMARCLVWKVATIDGECWVADRAYPECVNKRSMIYSALKAQAEKEGKPIYMPFGKGGRHHEDALPCAVLDVDYDNESHMPYFDAYPTGCLIEDGNQMVIGALPDDIKNFCTIHNLWAATNPFTLHVLDRSPQFRRVKFTPTKAPPKRVEMIRNSPDEDLSLRIVTEEPTKTEAPRQGPVQPFFAESILHSPMYMMEEE